MNARLRRKHQAVIDDIFARPRRPNVVWTDIEALLVALGAEVIEGAGSRVTFHLNGATATFHRPHPRKETDKGALRSVERFLTIARIKR